jgi:hypothetical protein
VIFSRVVGSMQRVGTPLSLGSWRDVDGGLVLKMGRALGGIRTVIGVARTLRVGVNSGARGLLARLAFYAYYRREA